MISPSDLVVKGLPANAGDVGSIPGSGKTLEKEMATTSVFLPGRLGLGVTKKLDMTYAIKYICINMNLQS